MRNAALITLLISGTVFLASAQERGHRASRSAEDIAQMRTDRLTEQLALTSDQQQAVYALSLENAQKMQTARKSREMRSAELRKARAAQMDERRNEMKASQERLNEILTADQRQLLTQQQTARAEKMKSMREARRNGTLRSDRNRKGKRAFHKNAEKHRTTETSPEATK